MKSEDRAKDAAPATSPNLIVPPRCSIEGCEKPSKARSFCGAHYMRWHRHGDPLGCASKPSRTAPTHEEFMAEANAALSALRVYVKGGVTS